MTTPVDRYINLYVKVGGEYYRYKKASYLPVGYVVNSFIHLFGKYVESSVYIRGRVVDIDLTLEEVGINDWDVLELRVKKICTK